MLDSYEEKKVLVSGIGEVLLEQSIRAKHMNLSIRPVRVEFNPNSCNKIQNFFSASSADRGVTVNSLIMQY